MSAGRSCATGSGSSPRTTTSQSTRTSPRRARPRDVPGYYNNYTTKETFRASRKDTIVGYYQLDGSARERNLSALTSPESAATQESNTHMYNGKWQRVWSNRLFSELNVGDFGYHFPQGRSSTTGPTRRGSNRDGRATGAAFAAAGANGPFVIERNKPQLFATAPTSFRPAAAPTI